MLPADPHPNEQFTCNRVLAEVKSHESVMNDAQAQMAFHKATWSTQFWAYGRAATTAKTWQYGRSGTTDIEVNRLAPAVTTYLASLYRVANRVALNPDPQGRGNAEMATIACNAWLSQKVQQTRFLSALRQGMLYPGCGLKVGVDAGTATAIERVWMRVIPWWEMVLDRNVTDPRDERFRGHLFWRPRKEVEDQYPELAGKLTGQARTDFLASVSTQTRPRQTQDTSNEAGAVNGAGSDDDWVRTLEFCNLVDTIEVDGITYAGRLEIWVLDQGDHSKKPIHMGPLPFSAPDGSPLANIIPLIFNAEPEYPYRGIPPVARMMPQIAEMNLLRSRIAASSRLNARKGVFRPSALGAKGVETLQNGEDMEYAPVESDFEGDLSKAVYAIPSHPISTDLYQWNAIVTADFSAVQALPPAAQGQYGKKGTTAFEVQTASLFTESEMGMHASVLNSAMVELMRLVLCGMVLALTRTPDSTGGYGDEDAKLAAVSATHDLDGKEAAPSENDADTSSPDPFVALRDLVTPKKIETPNAVAVVQDTLTVVVDKRKHAITAADLRAEFDIQFVEGARTPLTDAARQQALVQIGPRYEQLWAEVVKGGPMAILAEMEMRALCDQFGLPKDMEVDTLLDKLARQKQAEPPPSKITQAAQPAAAPQAPAPEPQGPPAAEAPDQRQMVAQASLLLGQGRTPDALAILAKTFGDNPKILDLLNEIAALPPDQQVAAIGDVIRTISQTLGLPEMSGPMADVPPGVPAESSESGVA